MTILKIHLITTLLALMLVLTNVSMAEENQQAMMAYQEGDFNTAYTLWQSLVQQGHTDADYHLAELYRRGQGVDKSALKAESHYQKAATEGHALAQLQLGQLYFSGVLGQEQKAKAAYWLEQAAKQNNADAQWLLGGMLFNGDGVEQNSAKAYSWLTLASDQNHFQAAVSQAKIKSYLTPEQHKLADELSTAFRLKYNAKNAISEQEQKAFYWFKQAAEKNDAQAQYRVGKMYMDGQGVSADRALAYVWLTRAIGNNYSAATPLQAQLAATLTTEELTKANILLDDMQYGSLTSPQLAKTPELLADKQKTQPFFRVQLASFTTLLDVDIAIVDFQLRFPKLLAEYAMTVTEPNLDRDKDYYRVQLGEFDDKNSALELCQQFIAQKQDCFVAKVRP